MSLGCSKYFWLIEILILITCTSCSYQNSKEKVREESKSEPFIRVKEYNYKTDERVHITIRGLKDCKLKVDPEQLFFQKSFVLPNKYIKQPQEKKNDDESNDDLVHF